MSKHIIEALGKAKITIENGKVTEITEPQVDYCPLFHKHRGIEKIDKEIIKENIDFRIADFGMCSPNRQLRMKDFLSFGISETISTLLSENTIDCAVMVCDGAGTVLVTDSEMAQGVGGRVSGFVETAPIKEIINQLGSENVLNKNNAEINQLEGVKLAVAKGFKNIVVTVAKADDAIAIKSFEKEINISDSNNHSDNTKSQNNVNIYIFTVHSTGLSKDDAKTLCTYSDVVTSCASKYIREIGEEKAILKVGESIPVYGFTNNGKEFLEARLNKIAMKLEKKEPNPPRPLI
ncbi:MAG: methanogenesis marker 8 protein [Methanobacteriaceae archaeon]